MTLLNLKQYLMQVKMTSLQNLCLHFNSEAETVRCMLSHWIRKGNVKQCMKKPACATKCFKCPVASIELYEWIEAPTSFA
jgi:putative ferrous iron transport protein C